jgi:hypothetical protein
MGSGKKYLEWVFTDMVKHTKVIRPNVTSHSKAIVISPINEDYWLFFSDFKEQKIGEYQEFVYDHLYDVYSITESEFLEMWKKYCKFVREEVIFYG